MRPTPDVEWHFEGPEDGAAYRAEVARLWAAWMIGMGALVFAESGLIWLAGIGVLVVVLLLARPLQARAARIVPEDDLPELKMSSPRRRSTRDRVLRELAFGEAPLRASGGGPSWIWARRIVVISTSVVPVATKIL